MICKKAIAFLLVLCSLSSGIQSKDSTNVVNSDFKKVELLDPLFEKLYQLENNQKGKVNVVHIGDSHIQADMFTNAIRQILQTRFGNGGYGFTFPYRLAKTNGTSYIKYTSDTEWKSYRNIFPITDVRVGLSGIGFYSTDPNFELYIDANPLYTFNKVKLFYPTKTACFRVTLGHARFAQSTEEDSVSSSTEKEGTEINHESYNLHTVASKETLYRISQNYDIAVEELKEINNLTSNTIKVGMDLKIPRKEKLMVAKVIAREEIKTEVEPEGILCKEKTYFSEFTLPMSTNQLTILSNNKQSEYNLSGIVLENDKPGIIYHNIGVNGAKISDYLKYPLFFEQLPALQADLLIISLGTNEAFNKWATPYYLSQMQLFIDKIRENNPKAIVLLMTPPPSLVRRRTPNAFLEGYGNALKQMKDCVVWDLLTKLGGTQVPLKKAFAPLMARDKVHYTREGYEMQGDLFSTDFLGAYDNYLSNKN